MKQAGNSVSETFSGRVSLDLTENGPKCYWCVDALNCIRAYNSDKSCELVRFSANWTLMSQLCETLVPLFNYRSKMT